MTREERAAALAVRKAAALEASVVAGGMTDADAFRAMEILLKAGIRVSFSRTGLNRWDVTLRPGRDTLDYRRGECTGYSNGKVLAAVFLRALDRLVLR